MNAAAKYKNIYDTLVRELEEGVFPVGSCLPTENELAERFGVSRQTVLKALDLLKNEGFLTGVRGRGTFVIHSGGLRPDRRRAASWLSSALIRAIPSITRCFWASRRKPLGTIMQWRSGTVPAMRSARRST